MYNSEFLRKFKIEENIAANKYNFFYLSYQFTLIKEHILDNSNYPSLMPRLNDIIHTVVLGVSNNINASFSAILYLLTFFKNQIYDLKEWQLYELKIMVSSAIDSLKNQNDNNLLETNKEQFHKEQVLNKLSEIADILDQLIKINGGELFNV